MTKAFSVKSLVVAASLCFTAPAAMAIVTPAELGLSEADILSVLQGSNAATAAPGISFGSPVAFGLNWGEVGFGLGGSYDPDDPAGKEFDGSLAVSFGLGDSVEAVGIEIIGGINSLESQRGQDSFGSEGSFGAKLHTVLPGRAALALGVENVARFGKDTEQTESSVYVVGTKFFDLAPQSAGFKYPMAVNVGFGNGRFLRLSKPEDQANIFGSLEFLLSPVHSLTMDWTGRDLNVGVSVLPFPQYPFVITVGGINLTHQDGNRAAYAANIGYLVRF